MRRHLVKAHSGVDTPIVHGGVLARCLAALCLVWFATACGGGSDTPAGPVVDVAIADTTFNPATVNVVKGGGVRFTNTSKTERHNIIPVVDGTFTKHADLLKAGESVTIVFKTTGAIAYYCALHGSPTSGQRGVVQVG